ncbi:hypothetical protein [Microcoleus vaginatus]|uniref:hypothetical protein n=1 Tax=Microcoleus vaginatus TaxID=119532 RepID=UPI0016863988|nr:hypothetical protein [Microcoleus sp. FACHB-84]MBD2007759.1 hypothetical protein [Microcoleus sp. FACHB-45]
MFDRQKFGPNQCHIRSHLQQRLTSQQPHVLQPRPQKLTVSVVPAHGSAKCCHSETELRSRRQDISLPPLSKILKQPQRRNPSSTPIICSQRQRDRDFYSRILHDRLAVNQLPTTSAIDRLLSYPESYQFCWLCRRGKSRPQKLFA